MSLILEHKGRSVDLSKPWSEMSAEERQILEDRAAVGEKYRRELIRFGYLSEEERRRLVANYPDLPSRFEPALDPSNPFKHALFVYIALIFGIALGSGHLVDDSSFISWRSIWLYVGSSVFYWSVGAWILRTIERSREERNELYWEWRGYKSDKYGRKIG